jgi:heme/copper-type cytochrome/quinol oxidase subunit 4
MFPVLSRAARLQALVIAGLAAASVVAQWVYLMDLRGTGPVETVLQMARFFTILTMVLVVIAFAPFPSARRAASVRRRLRQSHCLW